MIHQAQPLAHDDEFLSFRKSAYLDRASIREWCYLASSHEGQAVRNDLRVHNLHRSNDASEFHALQVRPIGLRQCRHVHQNAPSKLCRDLSGLQYLQRQRMQSSDRHLTQQQLHLHVKSSRLLRATQQEMQPNLHQASVSRLHQKL